MELSAISDADLMALKSGDLSKVSDAWLTAMKGSPQATNTAWSDVPLNALQSIPKSAANFAGGIYQAMRHPLDTGMNLWDAAAGGLHNMLPKGLTDAIEINQPAADRAVNTANAVGGFYKDRYGSMEGLKNTLSNDPVGAAADVSTVLGMGAGALNGGASLVSKIPALSGASNAVAPLVNALRSGSNYTNPMIAAGAAISKGSGYLGKGVANIVGGLGTHTGGEPLQQAAKAGMEGGDNAASFIDNLRGNVNKTDVLETAKANLETMKQTKSAEYRSGMAAVSGDKSVLGFDGIDKAVNDAANAVSFKGQVKNVKAADVQSKIADAVNQWKSLDPNEYHTPEGFDALKQQIGGIVESVPFEEKTARMVGDKVYHAVKIEIVKQAPVYADVMKSYSDASDMIKEIERALVGNQKTAVDTSMRKLQSLMRNNVNTNYGNRLDLAKTLEQQGGQSIMPALAGQALSSWTPRGLGGAVASGLGMGGYALGGSGLAIPTLAAQSPRLMGEAALKIGQLVGALRSGVNGIKNASNSVGLDPKMLANLLYQSGRLPQQSQTP